MNQSGGYKATRHNCTGIMNGYCSHVILKSNLGFTLILSNNLVLYTTV